HEILNNLDSVLRNLRDLYWHNDQAVVAKNGIKTLIDAIEAAKKEPVAKAYAEYEQQRAVARDIAQVKRHQQKKPVHALTDALQGTSRYETLNFQQDNATLPNV